MTDPGWNWMIRIFWNNTDLIKRTFDSQLHPNSSNYVSHGKQESILSDNETIFLSIKAAKCSMKFRLGVTKLISIVTLFSCFFIIIKPLVTYWISCSYLTGVTTAKLWWHLSNRNMTQSIQQVLHKIIHIRKGDVIKQSFSNPHPRSSLP